jgi:hypothetical protein
MSIDALFASPLLGRSRQRALHQAGTLAMALLDAPDPVAEARLLAWGALHAQIARAPDADRLLLDAMGRCARLGQASRRSRRPGRRRRLGQPGGSTGGGRLGQPSGRCRGGWLSQPGGRCA